MAQGRFSGRLVSKQDEARLIEECQRLGPLLGGASGGIEELKRTQLSQIVRAIASGEVCDHLQCICNMQQVSNVPCLLHASRSFSDPAVSALWLRSFIRWPCRHCQCPAALSPLPTPCRPVAASCRRPPPPPQPLPHQA